MTDEDWRSVAIALQAALVEVAGPSVGYNEALHPAMPQRIHERGAPCSTCEALARFQKLQAKTR